MKVTIIGAGNTGLAMAAHLSRDGYQVTLWNRSRDMIERLLETRTIICEGVIEGSFPIDVVTDNLSIALKDSDVVLITTPATAHRELAKQFGQHLMNEPIIVLNPGRTYGAIEFQLEFSSVNPTLNPMIAETQTAIYTSRKLSEDTVKIYSIKSNVLISTFDPKNNQTLINRLPETLRPYLSPARSMIETSIGNVGMVLHTTPLLLNAGWTENDKHFYHYYKDGITPTISRFIEKIDGERIDVSRHLGLAVESTKDWMKRVYNIEGESLYECIQNNEAYQSIIAPDTLRHRYIYEDISCGLVPLEAIGKSLQLEMEYTGLIIDLASALLDTDFRQTGRNLSHFSDRRTIKQILQVGEVHVSPKP